jgi:hypothetical protein
MNTPEDALATLAGSAHDALDAIVRRLSAELLDLRARAETVECERDAVRVERDDAC